MKKYVLVMAPVVIAQVAVHAAAQSTFSPQLPEIHWSLFFNAGYARTDSRESYLGSIDHDGDWSGSSLGLNFIGKLDNRFSIQGQLFGHDQNDGIVLDWFFLTYQIDGQQQVKVGKIKYPGTLLSEYPDIGHAYPWIRPPQEFYAENNSGVVAQIESFKGISYGYSLLTEAGLELKAQAYGGNSEAHESEDTVYKKMLGAKLSAEGDPGLVYVSVARANNEVSVDKVLPYGLVQDDLQNEVSRIAATGWRVDYHNVVSYAEYARVTTRDNGDLDADMWYAMAGYRFGAWLPHVTRTSFEQDGGLEHRAWIVGVRYDVRPELALKLEYQRLEPDSPAGEPAVFFDEPPTDDRVNMYSVGLNYVFQ